MDVATLLFSCRSSPLLYRYHGGEESTLGNAEKQTASAAREAREGGPISMSSMGASVVRGVRCAVAIDWLAADQILGLRYPFLAVWGGRRSGRGLVIGVQTTRQ